jgi:hypothetical protein
VSDVKEITRLLAEPFNPTEVKFKPQSVKGNRALAIPYVDARVIQDRLDEVLGAECWSDEYDLLPDGSAVCKLRLKLGAEWISKMDVGSPSEQPDAGDRVKAAFSDALKRAAVKFGLGRYLYRLPSQWADYDPVKRQFVRQPQLPDWARSAARPAAKGEPPQSDDDEPATPELLRAAHRAIGQSKSKTWVAALGYFRVGIPDSWEEPSDEAAASEQTWLTRGTVRKILAALTPRQKPAAHAGGPKAG